MDLNSTIILTNFEEQPDEKWTRKNDVAKIVGAAGINQLECLKNRRHEANWKNRAAANNTARHACNVHFRKENCGGVLAGFRINIMLLMIGGKTSRDALLSIGMITSKKQARLLGRNSYRKDRKESNGFNPIHKADQDPII
jgi:hypothetical protein